MWRELIRSVCPGAKFSDGARESELVDAERRLGHRLPRDVRALLSEANGVNDAAGWTVLAWPLERILEENVQYRSDAAWSARLCFADDGAGAPFFCAVAGDSDAVYVYYPIGGETRLIADSMRLFWLGWLTGELTT